MSLRKGEIEAPGNATLAEDDPERVYLGPGYRRQGENYLFSGPVQPHVPEKASTIEGKASAKLTKIELELERQERKLEELYEPLLKYGERIREDARLGRAVTRTGMITSIFQDIQEQKFIIAQLREALADEKKEG